MKAIKYKVKVYKSTLNFTHDFGTIIEEIFIPDKKIIFNIENETINVFHSEKPHARTN